MCAKMIRYLITSQLTLAAEEECLQWLPPPSVDLLGELHQLTVESTSARKS